MNNMHVVIVQGLVGDKDHVVMFDEVHNPVPYIKKQLKQLNIYSEAFQNNIKNISSVEDAQEFIECFNVQNFSIHFVEKINPKEDK